MHKSIRDILKKHNKPLAKPRKRDKETMLSQQLLPIAESPNAAQGSSLQGKEYKPGLRAFFL
ncbi:MAG: hypothetical protein SO442_01485 [Prevotella sp.]|nr:hypothetical protein [Prevotella sp.]